MTLREWSERWPYTVKDWPTGAKVTPDSFADRDLRAEAFHLSDYVVSSVTGGSIWLSPRD